MDVGGLSDAMTAAVEKAAPSVVRISRRRVSASGTVADLAIDADTSARVVADLRDHGRVRRGWVGVAVNPVRLPERLRAEAGQDTAVVVIDVETGGPAERAGVMVGDLVLGVDAVRVTNPADLAAALWARPACDVSLRIARGGVIETRAVTTTERA